MTTESKFRQLLRKRITLKRRPPEDGRRDFGFSMIQLVIAMIIVAVLATIAGPPLYNLVFRAERLALHTNIQSAAETVETTLSTGDYDLATAASSKTGELDPTGNIFIALQENLPVEWSHEWAMNSTSGAIHIQFLRKTTTGSSPEPTGDPVSASASPYGTVSAPTVPWIATHGGAVRLHAQKDGEWACALILLRPINAGTETARIARGVWYDSGEALTTNGGLNDCSPTNGANVLTVRPATKATTPANINHIEGATWTLNTGTNERTLTRQFE